MNKSKLLLLSLLCSALIFTGCEDEDDNSSGKQQISLSGAFITNEGSFGKGNASISFYDFKKDTVFNDIYKNTNNRTLGDVLQSAFVQDNKTFMVLNGSNKIEIATTDSFKQVATIEGFKQPRYLSIVNNKAYVSQWGEYTDITGSVAVVDLSTNTISSTIPVGSAPEGVSLINGNIWVANSGGFGVDSTISVIDPKTNAVIKTIVVGDNPKEMVTDKNGNIWVICNGSVLYNTDYSIKSQTASKLVKVSANNFSVLASLKIGDEVHPSHLDINKDKTILYYGGGFGFEGIWAVSIDANEKPSGAFLNGFFYAFNVNPQNGDIYTCEAPSFDDAGIVTRYTESGTKIKSYSVGVGPNGVVFKK